MTTSPDGRAGIAQAEEEAAAGRPLRAIAYALVVIARELRQIADDVRDIRRQGARR